MMVIEIEPIIKYWLQITSQMQVEQLEIEGVRTRLQINLDDVIFYRLSLKGKPDDILARGHPVILKNGLSERQKFNGSGRSTLMDEGELKRLIQDVLSYFPRALAYLKIGDFKSCALDVHHCLAIVKYVSLSPSISSLHFQQMAPILHMLYYLSLAALSLENGHRRRAVGYMNRGIQRIRSDHKKLGDNIQFSGYEEVLRMKLFKRMIIHTFGRKKSKVSHSVFYAGGVAWETHPQDHICYLLSAPWR